MSSPNIAALIGLALFLLLIVGGVRLARRVARSLHGETGGGETETPSPEAMQQRQQARVFTAPPVIRPRLTLPALLALHSYIKWYYRYQHAPQNGISEAIFVALKGKRELERVYGQTTRFEQWLKQEEQKALRQPLIVNAVREAPAVYLDELDDDDEPGQRWENDGEENNEPPAFSSFPSSPLPPPTAWDNLLAIEQRGGRESQWVLHGMIGDLLLLVAQGENLSRNQLVDKKHHLSDSQYQYLIGSSEWSETRKPGLLRRAGVIYTDERSKQTLLSTQDAVQLYLRVSAFQGEHPRWWSESYPGEQPSKRNAEPRSFVENERGIADEVEEKEGNEDDDEYEYGGV